MNAPRWTYKVVDIKPTLLGLKAAIVESTLNQYGAQGWDVVSVINNGLTLRVYLKKPL